MKKIIDSALELIGNTPMLKPSRYLNASGSKGDILVKLEYLNPAGSIKDRAALEMIEDAERSGKIKPGATLIEPTSGNTGIGLALAAAIKGYKTVIVLPDSMSVERQLMLKAYGAELVLTPGEKGLAGSIEKAEEINRNTEGSIIVGQFENPANPASHYKTTGPEIWEQTEGKVDILVAGVGTGGTITGIGRYLKEKNPAIKVIAVEPFESQVLKTGVAGAHGIQGIGANFVPKALDLNIIDEILPVKSDDACAEGNRFAKSEGIIVGISSGAALKAAVEVANRTENEGKTIVAVLPDSGDRYLSTAMFS